MKFKLAANKTRYILPTPSKWESREEKGEWRQGKGKEGIDNRNKKF